MTLTRFQRGDPMEGWNDCPSVMLPAASAPRGSRRRVKRVGHDINSSTDSLSPHTAATPGAVNVPTAGPPLQNAATPGAVNAPTAGPPIRRPPGPSEPYNRELSGSWVVIPNTEEPPEIEKLQHLFSLPSSLPAEVFSMYRRKLQEAYSVLKGDDLAFINSIVNQTIALPSLNDPDDVTCAVDKMKTQVLSYMMINTNASPWCVPLKKVVEGITI